MKRGLVGAMQAAARGAVLLGLAGVCTFMAACSSGPTKPKPTPLETVAPKIAGKQVWRKDLGGAGLSWRSFWPGAGDTKVTSLRIAATDDAVVLGSADGRVLALSVADGRELWRGDAKGALSAGVGSDGRYAAVVTADNELAVLDGGKAAWRATLPTRVVTPPLVAGERVFVLGIDRSVQAFDVLDGRKLWLQPRSGDPLSLLQPGVLLPFKDTLLAGEGPKLVGLDPLKGSLRWDATIASPRGTNELERLADLVGPAARAGDVVCARGFQVAIGCVNAGRGALSWSKNLSGSTGVTADAQFVFAVDANDRVVAYKLGTGEVAWASDRLLYRGLSAPLVVGRTLVVGDFEGQLHFLDRETGEPLLRLATDGKPMVGAPVRVGNTIVLVTESGEVFAFRPE